MAVSGGNHYEGDTPWGASEAGWVAKGINWSWKNGADVINMSFSCAVTNAIDTAIRHAVDSGRNGLGCVLVAAAGNSGTSTTWQVQYPARSNLVI
jgi:subtilisin family serine protease